MDFQSFPSSNNINDGITIPSILISKKISDNLEVSQQRSEQYLRRHLRQRQPWLRRLRSTLQNMCLQPFTISNGGT